VNLSSESSPAKSAQVLTGHLNTFLASMQAYYAGALGVAYINIMYAPMLEGLSEKELLQRAQELIFNGSQTAFSRGGQTIFLDFNIHSDSRYRKPCRVGPGGK
jgi:ribonucleoside-triphosphate reductase